jgi:hypothetical protein
VIGSDETVAERAEGAVDLLLYDYFKHLTTLSLVALGGVLGIADGQEIARDALLLVVLLIGLGGAFALNGLHMIVRARMAARPLPRSIRWYRMLSGGAFSLGVGVFLSIFLRAIR